MEWPNSRMTLNELQSYIQNKDHNPDGLNGYFFKLIEETGELAEAMRKNLRQRSSGGIKGTIEEELADVLYYIVCLANVYGIDLEHAFRQKDELNRIKWGQQQSNQILDGGANMSKEQIDNTQSTNSTTLTEDGRLVITRLVDAPRDLVFQVWSDIKHLQHWWGPAGLTWEHATLDFRPGGKFHYRMSSPDGYTLWGRFVYEEIHAPSRIVFINSFSDEEGNAVRPPFSELFPIEVRNEVSFEEINGRTLITLTGGPINASEEEHAFFRGMFDSMKQGFGGTFDQLDRYIANQ